MDISTAAPPAAARAMSHHRSARLTGSTPVVGSSRTSRSGSGSSAATTPSLRRIPPDSCPASRSRPRRARSVPGTRRPRGRPPRPLPVDGRTEPQVLCHGEVVVHAGARRQISDPPGARAADRPPATASAPATQRSSVVLPAPSPPTTAVTWPGGAATVTWSSARTPPKLTETAAAPHCRGPRTVTGPPPGQERTEPPDGQPGHGRPEQGQVDERGPERADRLGAEHHPA